MITCEVCGEKPAKIHVTQIKDNKKVTLHMCQDCARKQAAEGLNAKLTISGLLSGLLGQEAAAKSGAGPSQEEFLTCSSCGQPYRAFRESGKLGCAACYDTFEDQLLPLLRKIQKGDRHIGKQLRRRAPLSREEQLADLRRQLQQAVAREEFERAAQLRDEIRQAETESKK